MHLRLGSAFVLAALQAVLLASCTDMARNSDSRGFFDFAMATPAPATTGTIAQSPADPSLRVNELRAGLTLSELEAMYPGRLAFDSQDQRNALYFVEPDGVPPNSAVPRERLVLWLNDGRLATFDVVPSSEPVAVATVQAPAPATTTGSIARPRAARAKGQYGVQIAAAQSEAEARALIASLRAKFPAQLGSQWADITRVSLPQGVFYRVVVGPLASQQQAAQLCASLKAQGAECIIRGT